MVLFLLLASCRQDPAEPILTAEEQIQQPVVVSPEAVSAQNRVQLLAESEDLTSALENVRKVIASKPMTFSYEILEDGSVAECQLQNIDGQQRLTTLLPLELVDELCRALSKRRYHPPGVRVKAEISFGTPLFK